MKSPIGRIAWRRLAPIDLPRNESGSGQLTSNQHELQGVRALLELFGVPQSIEPERFNVRWILHDDAGGIVSEVVAPVTWYDARARNPDRAPEYRLYYPAGTGLGSAGPDDLLLVVELADFAVRDDCRFVFHIIPHDSELFDRVTWSFGLRHDAEGPMARRMRHGVVSADLPLSRVQVMWDIDPWLAEHPEWTAESSLESAVRNAFPRVFETGDPSAFPKTIELATLAQSLVRWTPDDPDGALERALAMETQAFSIVERAVLESRLKSAFIDVDDFVRFSLSIQNRRKSRRGHSLEHQLAWVFRNRGLQFETQVTTDDNRSTIDFLFPSLARYQNLEAPILTGVVTLAAKSTCKERWRQVVTEARKMRTRHLCTLETGISAPQTMEMGQLGVHLVVPNSARDSFPAPGTVILGIADFLRHVEAHV